MAAATTIIAAAAVASAVAGIGSTVLSATNKPKAPKINNNVDPGALTATEARTDTGAQVKVGKNDKAAERVSGRSSGGTSAKGGTGLGALKPRRGLGGF